MTALLDQLPTLAGVLLGALGAMASSTLTDRLRWRRDQTVRWDQRRIDAYIAFGSTLKDAVRISHRLTSQHRMRTDFGTDRATAVRELDTAEAQNSKDWELLLLLGDPEVVDAGRRWRLAAQALVAVALRDEWDAADWTTAVHDLDHTRDEFHAAARRSLRVSGHSVAQFDYLREMHGDALSPAPGPIAR